MSLRRSLPPLGVRLFKLRGDVVIILDASAADVAASPPSSNAWACLQAARAAQPSLRRRREPGGWLTLREVCALLGCDEREARLRLRALDKREAAEQGTATRRVGRWELVSAAALTRYFERFGGCVSEDVFVAALHDAHAPGFEALALEDGDGTRPAR